MRVRRSLSSDTCWRYELSFSSCKNFSLSLVRLSIHLNKLIGSNFSSPSKTNEFDNWIVRGDSVKSVDTQKKTLQFHGRVSSFSANEPQKVWICSWNMFRSLKLSWKFLNWKFHWNFFRVYSICPHKSNYLKMIACLSAKSNGYGN